MTLVLLVSCKPELLLGAAWGLANQTALERGQLQAVMQGISVRSTHRHGVCLGTVALGPAAC